MAFIWQMPKALLADLSDAELLVASQRDAQALLSSMTAGPSRCLGSSIAGSETLRSLPT